MVDALRSASQSGNAHKQPTKHTVESNAIAYATQHHTMHTMYKETGLKTQLITSLNPLEHAAIQP